MPPANARVEHADGCPYPRAECECGGYVPLATVERVMATAERYGEAIIRISNALAAPDLSDKARIMRARSVIVGLYESEDANAR